jgi:hypothetical protein
MEDHAAELLAMPDAVLFAHGGCHVFALVLQELYHYPLVSLRGGGGQHNHVACAPEQGVVLDVYGWFPLADYIKAEGQDLAIRPFPLDIAQLQRQFIVTRGHGFYAHQDFVVPASARAKKWIAGHREFFDKTKMMPIPGLCRVIAVNAKDISWNGKGEY